MKGYKVPEHMIDGLKNWISRFPNDDKYAWGMNAIVDEIEALPLEELDDNWHTGTPTEAGWYLFRYIYKAEEMGNKYFYATEKFIEVDEEILNLGDCGGGSQITKIYPLVKKIEWQKIEPYEASKERE